MQALVPLVSYCCLLNDVGYVIFFPLDIIRVPRSASWRAGACQRKRGPRTHVYEQKIHKTSCF